MSTNIIEKLSWRYATKKFNPDATLPKDKITVLKEAFNLTATSYGLQPLKMIVISNPEIKQSLMPITMQQPQVVEASHVLVLCTETKLTSSYIKNYFTNVEKTRDTPRAILSPFETFLIDSFSEKPAEEIKTWMQKQAYIAMGNLLTVCAIEGIDACPIEGFEPKKYDTLLGLDKKGLESVLVLAVGYRNVDDLHATLKKVRRGVKDVVIEMD